METISRDVDALQPALREALEAVVGHALQSNQRLIIQVLEVDRSTAPRNPALRNSKLPSWCNVLGDLTPDESAALDASLNARTESRSTPSL